MRFGGGASPSARKADRTRSRLSPTALSAPDNGEGELARPNRDLNVDRQDIDPLESHRPHPCLHP
jgi:hypothetical protein